MKPGAIGRTESLPAGSAVPLESVLDAMPFDEHGLVPAIAQAHDTLEVLMLAWMNREALEETLRTGRVCYWSRSRSALWRKGERSGQTQALKSLRLDCDGDTLLLLVDQKGPACHTGRRSCFYNLVEGAEVRVTSDAIVDPVTLYGTSGESVGGK